MQSTALVLMNCENAMTDEPQWLLVPVYDYIIFCDLGLKPPWVSEQVEFVENICQKARIRFVKFDSPLYRDFVQNFGERRTVSIPW